MLASAVLTTAIADAEPDQTEMAVSLTTKVGVRGVGTIELRDQVFSSDGLSPRALSGLRGVRAMGELLNNPFEPVGVDRLEFDVRIEYRQDFAEIVSVALPSDEVRAGDTVPLRVTLRPYAGREYVETVPVADPRAPGRPAGAHRGRLGRHGPPGHGPAREPARLHREPAQLLHGLQHRRQPQPARGRRLAARPPDPQPAARPPWTPCAPPAPPAAPTPTGSPTAPSTRPSAWSAGARSWCCRSKRTRWVAIDRAAQPRPSPSPRLRERAG